MAMLVIACLSVFETPIFSSERIDEAGGSLVAVALGIEGPNFQAAISLDDESFNFSFEGIKFLDGEFLAWGNDGFRRGIIYNSATTEYWGRQEIEVLGEAYPKIDGIVKAEDTFHLGNSMGGTVDHLQSVVRLIGDNAEVKAFGNGLYVALSYSKLFVSSDGVDWTQIEFDSTDRLEEIVFEGGLFVGVGENGFCTVSNDGITWDESNVGSFSGDLTDVTYTGDQYVCCSDNGLVFASDNGITWLQLDTNFSELLNVDRLGFDQIEYGNGKIILLSSEHILESSGELTQWSFEESGDIPMNYLAYGNGMFVGVSTSGAIYVYGTPLFDTPKIAIQTAKYNYVQVAEKVFFEIDFDGRDLSEDNIEIMLDGVVVESSDALGEEFEWAFTEPGFHNVVVKITTPSGLIARDSVQYVVSRRDSIDLLQNGEFKEIVDVIEFKGSAYVLSSNGNIYRPGSLTDWNLIFNSTIGGSRALYKTNTALIMVGENGAYSSLDGIHWTFSDVDLSYPHVDVLSGGEWIVQANGDPESDYIRSRDGLSWEPIVFDFGLLSDDVLCEFAGNILIEGNEGSLIKLESDGNYESFSGPMSYNPRSAFVSGERIFLTYYDNAGGKILVFETSDLVSWKEIESIPEDAGFGSLERAASAFILRGDRGASWVSFDDMSTWTLLTFDSYLKHLLYWKGDYYAQTQFELFVLSEEKQWLSVSEGKGRSDNMVAFEKGFLAWDDSDPGGNNYGYLFTSSNAIDWNLFPEGINYSEYYVDMAFGASGFVAVASNHVAYSNGGEWTFEWNAAGLIGPIAFGNEEYVAASSKGGIATSSDGKEWSFGDSLLGGSDITTLEYMTETALFCCLTENGNYYTSPDARIWTQRSILEGDVWSLNYQGDKLFASGFNGQGVYVSGDGINWQVASEDLRYGSKIVYRNGLYLGEGGGLLRSIDGVEWEAISGARGALPFWGLSPVQNGIVAFGSSVDGIIAYYTEDGYNWERTSSTLMGNRHVTLANNVYYLGDSIKLVSDVDLILEEVSVEGGGFGVGDTITFSVLVRNNGGKTINMDGVSLDLKLTNENDWTEFQDTDLDPLFFENSLLESKSSSTFEFEFELPESFVYGEYGLQCWLNSNQHVEDVLVSNNFAWSEDFSIVFDLSYDVWKKSIFNMIELEDGSISGPEADADSDGFSNIVEFAFSSDLKDSISVPIMDMFVVDGLAYVRFNRRKLTSSYSIGVSVSNDFREWISVDGIITNTVNDVETIEFLLSESSNDRIFAKISLEVIE